MKHFLINLKRRPDRLQFWLRHHAVLGIDPNDVIVVEAVDKSQFTDFSEIAAFAMDLGLTEWKIFSEYHGGDDLLGYASLRLTHDLVFRHIIETVPPGERVSISNDDEVLNVDRETYTAYLAQVFDVITPDIFTLTHHLFKGETDVYDQRFQHLHASGLFFTRCIGGGANQWFLITPEGAKWARDLGRPHPDQSYLHVWYVNRQVTDERVYTALPEFTCNTGEYFGSDITNTRSEDTFSCEILSF